MSVNRKNDCGFFASTDTRSRFATRRVALSAYRKSLFTNRVNLRNTLVLPVYTNASIARDTKTINPTTHNYVQYYSSDDRLPRDERIISFPDKTRFYNKRRCSNSGFSLISFLLVSVNTCCTLKFNDIALVLLLMRRYVKELKETQSYGVDLVPNRSCVSHVILT